MKYFNNILDAFKNKQYLLAIGYCLIMIISLVLVFFLTIWIMNCIFSNLEIILTVIGMYVFAYLLIKEWLKSRREKKEEETEIKRNIMQQKEVEAIELEKSLSESNYIIVRRCLFSVLSDIAGNLGLVKPTNLSELDSPARTISQSGVLIFQYLVLKGKETPDLQIIKNVIQTRFTQKLDNLEFTGITQSVYIWNGCSFPVINIDEVLDCGNYIQVNIVFASEKYCSILELRKQNKLIGQASFNQSIKDSDF